MTAIDQAADEIVVEEEVGQELTELSLSSYLVAEVGTANTSVTLFDIAEGSYQILSRGSSMTTDGPPWRDVQKGVVSAVHQIENFSQRGLLNRYNVVAKPSRRDGNGVDYFGTVVSAASPLKTLMIGLLDDVSLASGRRVLHSIYAKEVDCFSLADKRSQEQQLKAMLRHQPDLVFIVGGTDGGADKRLMRLIDTAAIGIQLLADTLVPTVVFAGNRELQPKIQAKLADSCDLILANNVRPFLESEEVDQAIALFGDLYASHHVRKLPGFNPLVDWSDLPVIPVVHGFGAMCEFFAALHKGRIFGIDIGSGSVSVIAAEPGQVYLDVNSDVGLGRPLTDLWENADVDEVSAWAGLVNDQEQVINYTANKALRPGTVPVTQTEQNIETAIVREILRLSAEQAYKRWNWSAAKRLEPTEAIILRGAIVSNSANIRRMMVAVLAAVQPTGIFSVLVDRYSVLAALGLLAAENPHLVVQIASSNGVERLGWVIAPNISSKDGREILRLDIKIEKQPNVHKIIKVGDIEVIPLRSDQEAKIIAEPSPRTDIGAGPGNSRTMTVKGGALGLLIDARGRPMRAELSANGQI